VIALLLTLLIQGLVIGAAALVASFALRRHSPRSRIAVATLGLLAFLVPLPFRATTSVTLSPESAGSPSFLTVALFICAVGSLVGVARLAIEAFALRRIVQRSRPGDAELQDRMREIALLAGIAAPSVCLTADCTVPFVARSGGRSVLLLPRTMESLEDRLEAILLHEAAHLRAGDVTKNRLLALFAAIFWFHPVARLLVREIREAIEQRCDDFALAHTSPDRYAETLVEIAAGLRLRPHSSVAMASSESRALSGRLRRIARDDRPTARQTVVAFLLVVTPLLTSAALLVPAVRSEAAERELLSDAFRLTHQSRHPHPHRHDHHH
jgi:beta-lactamase regulating signal transducer with metallopeptidase domain